MLSRHFRNSIITPNSRRFLTRSQKFEDAYLAVVEQLRLEVRALGKKKKLRKFSDIEFASEMALPVNADALMFGKLFPGDSGFPTRMIVYRRPFEQRVQSSLELRGALYGVIKPMVFQYLKIRLGA